TNAFPKPDLICRLGGGEGLWLPDPPETTERQLPSGYSSDSGHPNERKGKPQPPNKDKKRVLHRALKSLSGCRERGENPGVAHGPGRPQGKRPGRKGAEASLHKENSGDLSEPTDQRRSHGNGRLKAGTARRQEPSPKDGGEQVKEEKSLQAGNAQTVTPKGTALQWMKEGTSQDQGEGRQRVAQGGPGSSDVLLIPMGPPRLAFLINCVVLFAHRNMRLQLLPLQYYSVDIIPSRRPLV
ncbi:UNVERIFIED_CONTAM: hypothetical protein K2H54_059616, partial [Gekko kuhli]